VSVKKLRVFAQPTFLAHDTAAINQCGIFEEDQVIKITAKSTRDRLDEGQSRKQSENGFDEKVIFESPLTEGG